MKGLRVFSGSQVMTKSSSYKSLSAKWSALSVRLVACWPSLVATFNSCIQIWGLLLGHRKSQVFQNENSYGRFNQVSLFKKIQTGAIKRDWYNNNTMPKRHKLKTGKAWQVSLIGYLAHKNKGKSRLISYKHKKYWQTIPCFLTSTYFHLSHFNAQPKSGCTDTFPRMKICRKFLIPDLNLQKSSIIKKFFIQMYYDLK